MFGYQTLENGREVPVFQKKGIAVLYAVSLLYALLFGWGGAPFLTGVSLLFAIAFCGMGLLLCRPRFPVYLLPVAVFLVAFLPHQRWDTAAFSLCFFLFGVLLVAGLRFRFPMTVSVYLMVLGAVAVLGVLLLLQAGQATGQYTPAAALAYVQDALATGRLRLQDALALLAEKGYSFSAAGVTQEEFYDAVLSLWDDVLVPLLPGFLAMGLTVFAYVTHRIAFAFLSMVPEYARPLRRKRLSFPGYIGIVYACLSLMVYFLPTANPVGAAFVNLYLLALPLMAIIGMREIIWGIRLQQRSGRFFFIGTLVFVAIGLMIAPPLTVVLVGLYGALYCIRAPRLQSGGANGSV